MRQDIERIIRHAKEDEELAAEIKRKAQDLDVSIREYHRRVCGVQEPANARGGGVQEERPADVPEVLHANGGADGDSQPLKKTPACGDPNCEGCYIDGYDALEMEMAELTGWHDISATIPEHLARLFRGLKLRMEPFQEVEEGSDAFYRKCYDLVRWGRLTLKGTKYEIEGVEDED